MKSSCFFLLIPILLFSCQQKEGTKSSNVDRLKIATFNQSKLIGEKTYRVYLPISYFKNTEKHYPVLYMMDGQNLFDGDLSYSKVAWDIHEVADSLVKINKMKEIIIVGIDNAGKDRFSEYMPQKPLLNVSQSSKDALKDFFKIPVFSDQFLAFLTQEFKPFMDKNYRTKEDAANTFVGGSSMGGLISMYAQCEYPNTFGGALCFSTHWPTSIQNDTPEFPTQLIEYFSQKIPQGKKWYFDFGTEGLDAFYEPYQNQIDSILQQNNYVKNKNWMTRKYIGHHHNEKFWNQRLHIPLEFVIGK